MITRNILIFSIILLKFHNYSGCESASKSKLSSPPSYDLNSPQKIELTQALNEISGIAYYPKDTSVFAIVDGDGLFFKIYLNKNKQVKVWRFDKKHDFEDLVLHDSTFYILISNGDIEKVRFFSDSLSIAKSVFPGGDKKVNEFETLYYDEHHKKLIMLCKNCAENKQDKTEVTAYGISTDSLTYEPDFFKIEVEPIAKKLGIPKLNLKPSAAAYNPISKELYILASVNKLLVILDQKGTFKEAYPLSPEIFKQPEGIAFTPGGDMLISNEAGKSGLANILIYKYKK